MTAVTAVSQAIICNVHRSKYFPTYVCKSDGVSKNDRNSKISNIRDKDSYAILTRFLSYGLITFEENQINIILILN